jgi:N-acetylglucosamine kinase-like BadF-type ATPase
MRFVLGFDGGGTKTECVLMDEQRHVRASARSGPSNPMRVGFGGALVAICESGRAAMQNAQLSPSDISVICAGLAGAAQPESQSRMQRLLETEFPGPLVHVCTDLDLTLEATGDGPAIVLIAGTGSSVVGRGLDGRIARVGGHGPLLGDEGSAYDVGRRAAISALREADLGKPNSPLTNKFLRELGIANLEDFHLHVYSGPDEVFPRIFPVVIAAANEGEFSARALLQEAANELASLISDMVTRLGLKSEKFLLVKTGGMVGRSAYFDQQLDERLHAVAPHAEFGTLVISPAEAAARLAIRLLPAATVEGH